MPIQFRIEQRLAGRLGRAGVLTTAHGVIHTPAFVSVGTKGAMKAMTIDQISAIGAEILMCNAYHLFLQPGTEIIREAGGIGKFMNWSGPIMTDSGGFQIFSLGTAYGKSVSKVARGDDPLLLMEPYGTPGVLYKPVTIAEDGVYFKSPINGDTHFFTPEKVMQIQHDLGADIIFAFDECTSPTEPVAYQARALDRTHRWAKRCLAEHKKLQPHPQPLPEGEGRMGVEPSPLGRAGWGGPALFGIVQGGRDEALRKESAKFIGELDFPGFGIGGSFVKEDMQTAVGWVNAILPEEKPRHLLGIGEPLDILMGVEQGCDLFDCVAPTRIGRNGTLYTSRGKINITNAQFTRDFTPIDEPEWLCPALASYSKAYLNHLFKAKEILASTLGSMQNLHFLLTLTKRLRQAILDNTFDAFKTQFLRTYQE